MKNNERYIANFTDADEQITILKSRNLKFEDEELAKARLIRYGYYSIINGYKDAYVETVDGKERYKDDVYFEQIYSLFIMDKNIRIAVLTSMLEMEEHIRALTSYVVAEHFTSDHTLYLKKENYKDRATRDNKYSLDSILKTLNGNLYSHKNPIKYHQESYKNVPPWILFKGTYMNTLVNFIRFFKKEQKEELLMLAFNIPQELAQNEALKELFSSILFSCLDYRNAAAHCGRIYNLNPSVKIRINNVFLDELAKVLTTSYTFENKCNLSQLLYSLSLFDYKTMHSILYNCINSEINRHCSRYPKDIEYISSVTGLEFAYNQK